MAQKLEDIRLVVLGGGPGGYPAAFHAADLGMQVTLINDDAKPGGVCLYRGCIPSKTLLHMARVINEAQEAGPWGVEFGKPKIDLDKLRAWKKRVVDKLTGGLGGLARKRNITYIQGRGRFDGPHKLTIDKTDGGTQALDFDYAIVATGSRPATVPAFDLPSPRIMDSTAALELEDIPKKLLIVGGGYIGLEMGTVYQALGSQVTVVEAMTGLLPNADRDLVDILARRLEKRFSAIYTSTKVMELKEEKNGIRAKLVGLHVDQANPVFDKVLISVGRRPNSSDLGLEATQVKLTKQGFIEVDAQRRTAEPNIFAVGDVAGEPQLAHKATHEGRVAADAIAGKPTAFAPHAIPAVVFTDPELAWAGLTEMEALNQSLDVKVTRYPWAASGRAMALDATDGLTKLIFDPRSERLLGAGIAGNGAGDMIAEATLAIEMGATATDLLQTVHAHPTLPETIMEASELFFGHGVHFIPTPERRSRNAKTKR